MNAAEEPINDMGITIAKGITGTVTPILGIIVSTAQEIETWMRIGSLAVGIVVGVVTLISLLRKKRE